MEAKHETYPPAQGWGDPEQQEDSVDVHELLRTIMRRRGVLFSTLILGTLITIITVFQFTPRYTADAKLLIGARTSRVVDIEQVLSNLDTSSETVRSQVEVLTSRELARKVIKKLNLAQSPEFNPQLAPLSFFGDMHPRSWLPEGWATALLGPPPGVGLSAAARRARNESQLVNNFLDSLTVNPLRRSRVISITATSEDADLAARIANVVADLYIDDQLEARFEATKRATDWLTTRVQELRGQVEAAEKAVELYRKQNKLVRSKNSSLTTQQISDLNTQLILNRTKTAEANARLGQVQKLLKSSKGVESAAEVLASPLIQRLREQQGELERRVAEMATEFGPRHPKMINIHAKVRNMRAKIKSEVNKIVIGLRNEVGIARARENTLKRNLDKLKSSAEKVGSAEVGLRSLEREATANRALFKTFLERLKETRNQDQIEQPDARVISKADIPVGPSFPKKRLSIVLGFVGSGFLGLLLVFLLEQLDRGFRSSEQIEQLLGVRTLCLLPMLSRLRLLGSSPAQYIIAKPASAYAESLRTLHTNLLLSDIDKTPRVILITSSLPKEGKTTTSVALARLIARSGKKVLLIDGDLRKRSAAGDLKLNPKPGLIELLAGGYGAANEVIQMDEDSGLHFLAAGEGAPSPPDLFRSEKMQQLLNQLTQGFELIIIDSPPVLVVSDALVLARLADKTVYVVRWAETPREAVAHGIRQFNPADVAGVALSQIDVRKNASYSYGDSGYYYGAARRYYTD